MKYPQDNELPPKNPNHSFRGYVLISLGLSLLLILAVLSINLLVDPYALRTANSLNLFPKKPEFSRNSRTSKTYAINHIKPDLVVLGSSRSDHGIDLTYLTNDGRAQRPYNASVDGTNMVELAAFFEHTLASGQLKSAIIGLDFHLFANKPGISPEDASILDSVHHDASFDRFSRRLRLSVTTDSIKSSFATVMGQHLDEPYDLKTGRRNESSFRQRLAAVGGATSYFVQWERKEAPAYLAMASARKGQTFVIEKADQFAALDRLLRLARKHDVDLKLFFSPMHARNAEVLAATGQWMDFENWKREVVRMVDDEGRSSSGHSSWPIWDFSGYNSVTTESLPDQRQGEGLEMVGYWDPSHYRKSVGNLILAELFSNPGRQFTPSFGVKLTGHNIEMHLSDIRIAQSDYRSKHSEDVAAIEIMVRDFRKPLVSPKPAIKKS